MPPLRIRYRLRLPDGGRRELDLELDPRTLEGRAAPPEPLPAWMRLERHRCAHCPLGAGGAEEACPVAVRVAPLLELGAGLASHQGVHLEVITPERRVSQDTTAQRALSSALGLAMATSGCPQTAFLKPMARFHLPLATELETVYRAASMYLLAQYFVRRQGGEADLGLEGLAARYRALQEVNRSLSRRLREACRDDAALNAVVLLDLFAKGIPWSVEEALEELRQLFRPYLPDPAVPPASGSPARRGGPRRAAGRCGPPGTRGC